MKLDYTKIIFNNDNYHFKFLKDCMNILDIGCGRGTFIKIAPDKIKGIEGNPLLVEVCKRDGLNVVHGDARDLPFEDCSFDGVRLSHVIEHFLPKDAYIVLHECARVLKPGGYLLIVTPLESPCFWNDPSHIRPYPPSSILMWVNPLMGHQNLQASKKIFEARYYSTRRRIPPFSFLGDLAPKVPGPYHKIRLLIGGVRRLLYIMSIRAFKASEYVLLLERVNS